MKTNHIISAAVAVVIGLGLGFLASTAEAKDAIGPNSTQNGLSAKAVKALKADEVDEMDLKAVKADEIDAKATKAVTTVELKDGYVVITTVNLKAMPKESPTDIDDDLKSE